MKLGDDLLVLELTTDLGTGPTALHPVVIADPDAGLTLVDAGIPGMEGAIETALAEVGASLKDIRRVILTHHDLDHIGSVPAVVAASGAQVWAPEREIAFIEGTAWPQKRPTPEQAEQLLADPNLPPQRRAILQRIRHLPPVTFTVDRALRDGEVLPLAGGVRVVGTPGHTVGHTSFYLERTGTLIAGDALASDGGTLSGPGPQVTPDMKTAGQSVDKLAQLDVRAIVTYHGGVVREDARGQLGRVAAELAAGR